MIPSKGGDAREPRVCPYYFGITPEQVKWPLAQFQGKRADQEGSLELLRSINKSRETALPDDAVRRSFERCWPEWEKALKSIPPASPANLAPPPNQQEMLEEIREILRKQERRHASEALLLKLSKGQSANTPAPVLKMAALDRSAMEKFDALAARYRAESARIMEQTASARELIDTPAMRAFVEQAQANLEKLREAMESGGLLEEGASAAEDQSGDAEARLPGATAAPAKKKD